MTGETRPPKKPRLSKEAAPKATSDPTPKTLQKTPRTPKLPAKASFQAAPKTAKDGPLEPLSKKQKIVFDFVVKMVQKQGYPPTLREIGNYLGISSTNGVNDHLKALERKGYLHKSNLRARGLKPLVSLPQEPKEQTLAIPVLGKVAAGQPIPRIEESDTILHVDPHLVGGGENLFALHVTGQSMIDDDIREGDFLFIRSQKDAMNGEIVVAVIDDEVTVKRFYREGERIRLQPANANMAPIFLQATDWKSIQILGIAVGLTRKF